MTIDVPANYVVGATGVPLPGQDDEAFMAERDAAPRPEQRSNALFLPLRTNARCSHFRQDRVHDFARFADKRFLVRRDSVTLENGHRVMTRCSSPRRTPALGDATEYVNESRSGTATGGRLPHDALHRGGRHHQRRWHGVSDASPSSATWAMPRSSTTIAHEVGLPTGSMACSRATNATTLGWMKGMNSFVELRCICASVIRSGR